MEKGREVKSVGNSGLDLHRSKWMSVKRFSFHLV